MASYGEGGGEEWRPTEKEEHHENIGREGVRCEGWEEEGVWCVGPGEEGVLCEGCGEEGNSQCRLHFLLHTGPTWTSVDPACGRRERGLKSYGCH